MKILMRCSNALTFAVDGRGKILLAQEQPF
jgi:hypothetical protein